MNYPCDLQFDEYFRYRAAAELVEAIGKSPLKILDVGGGAGRFVKFLEGHEALSVDGTCLPFPDRSFDIVVSIDVLEHLEPPAREAFIREMIRVARLKCIPAFPHAGATAATAVVNRYTSDWLKEHLDLGLPAAEVVEIILDRFGVRYRRYANLPLAIWVSMTIADWYAPDELKRPINTGFNRHFCAPATGKCYRLIYEIQPGPAA